MTDIEHRLEDLERRISRLESGDSTQNKSAVTPTSSTEELISVEVKNKRYDPENSALGKFEDHIWFDCHYTLSVTSKPTRAVKGLLEFSDLFGEVNFRINITLNDPLEPGKRIIQEGIGFNYNQFIEEHQWILGTDLKDMKVSFKVLHAIFSDGTSEAFA